MQCTHLSRSNVLNHQFYIIASSRCLNDLRLVEQLHRRPIQQRFITSFIFITLAPTYHLKNSLLTIEPSRQRIMILNNPLINKDPPRPIPSIDLHRIIRRIHLIDDETIGRGSSTLVEDEIAFVGFQFGGGAIQVADYTLA